MSYANRGNTIPTVGTGDETGAPGSATKGGAPTSTTATAPTAPTAPATATTATTATAQAPAASFERGGSKVGQQPGAGGGATLNVPNSLRNNPMVARSQVFVKNASPEMVANCKAMAAQWAAHPEQATAGAEQLLSAQILNGEVVIPPPNMPDAPATGVGEDAGGALTSGDGTPPPATGSGTGPATGVGTDAGAALSTGDGTPPATGTGTGTGVGTEAGGALSTGTGVGTEAGGALTGGGGAYGIPMATSSQDDMAIQNMGVLPPGGDIAEMCFVVLMEATNDQDKDLELIMAETKAQTNSKQALRDIISKVGRDVAANAAQQINDANGNPIKPNPDTTFPGTGGADFYTGNAPIPVPDANAQGGYDAVNTVLFTPPAGDSYGLTYNDLKSVQDDLKGRLDSMNEMSEMTSMRLQMAMDRRSKFVEALSNIMKKIDSTQETIVQNLKG